MSAPDPRHRSAQEGVADAATDGAGRDLLTPTPPAPATPAPAWRWLWAVGLLAAGIVLGLAFAAYGGADLLLNFNNLRYCG